LNPDRSLHIQTLVEALRASLAESRFRTLTLSKPLPTAALNPDSLMGVEKILMRPVLIKGELHVCTVLRFASKDITKNYLPTQATSQVEPWLINEVANAHLHLADEDIELITSRKGKAQLRRVRHKQALVPIQASLHNREKHYSLGLDAPFLAALGITHAAPTPKLVQAMAHKYKQINKFLELFQGALAKSSVADSTELRVLDFGAGKGYLTFAIDYCLSARGAQASHEVLGIELRPELVEAGNAICTQLGNQTLKFVAGDVRTHLPGRVDVMVALHACDTATDYAIHCGITNQAAVILCAPCCHKQLRPQMRMPETLAPLFKHGIHLGQEADMLTDGLRALLLEANGYQTQVFEFISSEHTAKNKMILAIRRSDALTPSKLAALRQQIAALKDFYGVQSHCLEDLLAAPKFG